MAMLIAHLSRRNKFKANSFYPPQPRHLTPEQVRKESDRVCGLPKPVITDR